MVSMYKFPMVPLLATAMGSVDRRNCTSGALNRICRHRFENSLDGRCYMMFGRFIVALIFFSPFIAAGLYYFLKAAKLTDLQIQAAKKGGRWLSNLFQTGRQMTYWSFRIGGIIVLLISLVFIVLLTLDKV